MVLSSSLRILIVAGCVTLATTARAATDVTSQPGKAAAHAALSAAADLPGTPPSLPIQASDQPHKALDNTAFGKKGEAESQAHASATKAANEAALDAHLEAATRAADGAVAAAARSANADGRAAAGQAQANTAKANGPGHHGGTTPTKP